MTSLPSPSLYGDDTSQQTATIAEPRPISNHDPILDLHRNLLTVQQLAKEGIQQLQTYCDKGKFYKNAYFEEHDRLTQLGRQFNTMIESHKILRSAHETLVGDMADFTDLQGQVNWQREKIIQYEELTPKIRQDLDTSNSRCFELEAQSTLQTREIEGLRAEVVALQEKLEQERDKHSRTWTAIAASGSSATIPPELKREIGDDFETEDPPKKRKARKLRVKVA